MTNFFRLCLMLGLLSLISACSNLHQWQWTQQYGHSVPTTFDVASQPKTAQVDYAMVRPILERRCAVCHGCYDAPCQMKMTAWEGIARGATPLNVYGNRLKEAQPTRLFEDALKASDWRQMGFHPVLNENPNISALDGSVLAQILLLKQKNPLPEVAVLPDNQFDFSLDRPQQCSKIENFSEFSKKNPLWGMPFGLHGLAQPETDLILRWIEQGLPRQADAALSPALTQQIATWERWLNADSPKAQLVARYIYEHLFLAHLYFGDDGNYFKLVRSRTPVGQAVDLIASRRPFDDPGVSRPYYRIVPLEETVLSKTHMPYRLDADKLSKWDQWFVKTPFAVDSLPGYAPELASNPFITFAAIPTPSRYRFMLEEAQFTVMGFIKGPVCRGQLAVDVINDHFWVYFMNPDLLDSSEDAQFLADNSKNLNLPSTLGSDAPLVGNWKNYAKGQLEYLAAKRLYSDGRSENQKNPDAALLWDGREAKGAGNQNAALTIFRNFDNASVEKGLIGAQPQTAWIIGYPLLERFHYLLVAGYDVFGSLGHQLRSRLYMDFLRIEGEQNFLSLLPDEAGTAVSQRWYRNAPKSTLEYVAASRLNLAPAFKPKITGETPELAYAELLKILSQQVSAVNNSSHHLDNVKAVTLRLALQNLQSVRGSSLQWLPQVTLIKVIPDQGTPVWLTLLNNTAYTSVAQIFFADKRRLPEEDSLTLTYGVVGSYPNAYWSVRESQLPDLTQQLGALKDAASYSALLSQFGVRRTHPGFWDLNDESNQAMKNQQGHYFGLLDLNRLENR